MMLHYLPWKCANSYQVHICYCFGVIASELKFYGRRNSVSNKRWSVSWGRRVRPTFMLLLAP